MKTRRFITTSRVAHILRVSDGTVREMARRGELQAIRTEGGNNVRLFDRKDVEALARARSGEQER